MMKRVSALLSLAVVAACSAERPPPPQPAARPQPRPVAIPAPRPVQTTPPVGWADMPLTPGTWTYAQAGRDSSASFGSPGTPAFILRCDATNRSVSLQRLGPSGGGEMSVRTSYGQRAFPVTPDAPAANATLSARDPFLDNMIFSRGRFSVEVPGASMLVLPAWAEAARVVEDCRK